jgi:hypothetical protein
MSQPAGKDRSGRLAALASAAVDQSIGCPLIVAASVLAETCLPHANGRNNVPYEMLSAGLRRIIILSFYYLPESVWLKLRNGCPLGERNSGTVLFLSSRRPLTPKAGLATRYPVQPFRQRSASPPSDPEGIAWSEQDRTTPLFLQPEDRGSHCLAAAPRSNAVEIAGNFGIGLDVSGVELGPAGFGDPPGIGKIEGGRKIVTADKANLADKRRSSAYRSGNSAARERRLKSPRARSCRSPSRPPDGGAPP